jgi:hypothetical protein
MNKKNTIRQDLAQKIYDVLNDNDNFAWYFRKKFTIPFDSASKTQFAAFSHIFYFDDKINSAYFDNAFEIVDEICKQENLKINKLHRIYANLYLNVHHDEKMKKNEIHLDSENPNCKTILYYVNDSDGNTLFYNDEKIVINEVKPQKGKYVIFESNKLHGAGIPVQSKFRMVLNVVFE